jgi:thiamine-phosphate pyrophosphorylase
MKSSWKLEGLYLVVSSILPVDTLLLASEEALRGGVDVLQVIVKQDSPEALRLTKGLSDLARKLKTPFLLNGSLRLARKIHVDGVHFDNHNVTPGQARRALGGKCIVGYTVGNDTKELEWAEEAGADYVSFCSVFSTLTAEQCEIVPLETIRRARSRTALPMFAAGGIDLDNAHLVLETGVDGIAVTSAVLKAKDPEKVAISLKQIIGSYRRNIS